jgi:hypothetical protein
MRRKVAEAGERLVDAPLSPQARQLVDQATAMQGRGQWQQLEDSPEYVVWVGHPRGGIISSDKVGGAGDEHKEVAQ